MFDDKIKKLMDMLKQNEVNPDLVIEIKVAEWSDLNKQQTMDKVKQIVEDSLKTIKTNDHVTFDDYAEERREVEYRMRSQLFAKVRSIQMEQEVGDAITEMIKKFTDMVVTKEELAIRGLTPPMIESVMECDGGNHKVSRAVHNLITAVFEFNSELLFSNSESGLIKLINENCDMVAEPKEEHYH